MMMNILNSFILDAIDSHKDMGGIEKAIIVESILAEKNYVEFYISNVSDIQKHIVKAKKYMLHYNVPKYTFGSQKFAYIFPDYQTADNELQNFYFSNKKKYIIDDDDNDSKTIQIYCNILEKFTKKDDCYEIDINKFNMEDYIELRCHTHNHTYDIKIEENKFKLPLDHFCSIIVNEKKYCIKNMYQQYINIISSRLYYNILHSINSNIYFPIYTFDKAEETVLIELVNKMLDEKYIFLKETNPNYDEFYDSTDQIYVLKPCPIVQ